MRRNTHDERGQVLIVAVMVLFGVATLAALFAAIVGAQIVQVTRYTDVAELRNVAEAGLRLANEQLVYGAHGADWRPQPGFIPIGRGQVTLKVSYGPTPTELQKRFLLISATATFGRDNPFLSYTVLGVKPLLLTDYARFITDRDELRQPAALGVTGVELAGEPRASGYGGAYQFSIAGPIRSNTDLAWYGNSQVNLSTALAPVGSGTWGGLEVLRDDRIEVAGEMRSGAVLTGDMATDQTARADHPLQLLFNGNPWSATMPNLFTPSNSGDIDAYLGGFPDPAGQGGNACRVLAGLPSYTTTFSGPLDPPDLSVPRVNPPRMDAVDPDMNTNRYLILTRDSGQWFPDATGAWHNRGEFGWGWVDYGGIYVDNASEIQYGHDLENLRLNWVGSYDVPGADELQPDGTRRARADGTVNWWDKTGRYYAPPGVEIILHGEAPSCPYLEVIRHDLRTDPATGTKYYWRDQDGKPIPAVPSAVPYAPGAGRCARPSNQDAALGVTGRGDRATFPFPPNGVIYAEGNVRLRGIMPVNRGRTTRNSVAVSGYFLPDTDPNTKKRYRNYDLQVVSGGTIYVEGDLLAAKSAGLLPSAPGSGEFALTEDDRKYGSRVALIARDNVCLNTTALHPRPANLYARDDAGQYSADSYNDRVPAYPDPDTGGYPPYLLFQGDTDPTLNLDSSASDATAARQETIPAGLEFVYTNVRLQIGDTRDLRLIMGHLGWYTRDVNGEPGEQTEALQHARAAVEVELQVNGTVRNWQNDSPTYTFKSEGNEPADGSSHWYLEPSRYPPAQGTSTPFDVDDYLEWLPLLDDQNPPQPIQAMNNLGLTGADALRFSPWITPVWDENVQDPHWIVKPRELGYVLGPLAITPPRGSDPMPVRVEAMVYAQNGSWFILPGPWFNEDPDEMPPPDLDTMQKIQGWFDGRVAPAYHEPLNLQLTFYGAISENRPAPVGDVTDWTSKWAGPYVAGSSAVVDGAYLKYEYDPLLRWTREENDGVTDQVHPRFPNLPLTPDLLIWGERVSGFAGG